MRSDESSTSFFQSVDKDGDGKLGAAEVVNFLEHEIGDTSSFVTTYEISSEANRVIRALDQNKDSAVEQHDVMEYWDHMENLLTAEQVEEWTVHAVQLPEYVGRIFKENVVTGYDFQELVENNGEMLTTELGITKPSFVKKIVYLMHARMLGIGSVPEPPTDIKFKVENCNSVTFTWAKSFAAGFPVHSYRIQRRAVKMFSNSSQQQQQQQQSTINTSKSSLDNNNNNNNICPHPDENFMTPLNYNENPCNKPSQQEKFQLQSHLNWVTAFVGADTEFFDHSLEPGYSFKYRIQAWNSVGRSTWVTVDISDQLKKLKCLKASTTRMRLLSIPNMDDSFPSHSFRRFYFVSGVFMNIARGIVAVTAFFAALMKWKRASTGSTVAVAAMKAPFPSLMQNINTMSKKILGMDIIPSFVLGKDNEVVCHDVTFVESDTPFDRRVKFSKSESNRNNSCRSLMSTDDSHSLTCCVDSNIISDSSAMEMKTKEKCKLKEAFERKKSQCGLRTDTTGISQIDVQQNSSRSCSSKTYNTNDEPDDYTLCNTCRKKYKIGKRWRHHCARCLSTFCHKHGRTTHSNLTSCKIPGSCVCNKCLEMDL